MGSRTINTDNKTRSTQQPSAGNWNEYYKNVLADYRGMKKQYPFSYLTILPTVKPSLATMKVIAANKDLIELGNSREADFLGQYSRELFLIVPANYKQAGCSVYGAKWLDFEKFRQEDLHFYPDDNAQLKRLYGNKLCVGTPDSFPLMKNVILENVRTAENMLIAYEKIITGASDALELIAYAHGEDGRQQFRKNRTKYIPKR